MRSKRERAVGRRTGFTVALGVAALAAWLLASTLTGCDCESSCEDDYRDCLEDPTMGSIECDIGYDQCLLSCNPMGAGATAAPDGGR